MRKTYKNKRDYYKSRAESLERKVGLLEREIKIKQEEVQKSKPPVKEERIEVAWFCPQCRVVQKGTIRRGYNIEGSDCLNCGKKGVMAVGKLPYHFN